jgi:hypothetical protein
VIKGHASAFASSTALQELAVSFVDVWAKMGKLEKTDSEINAPQTIRTIKFPLLRILFILHTHLNVAIRPHSESCIWTFLAENTMRRGIGPIKAHHGSGPIMEEYAY